MPSKFGYNLIGFLCLTLFTAACADMDLGTMWKYRNVDFLDVNPDNTRIAIELPEGVTVNKARVSVAGGIDDTSVFGDVIDLEIIRSGPEMATLPKALNRERAIILRVPRDQIATARDLQIQTHKLKNEPGPEGTRSLSVGFDIRSDASDTLSDTMCMQTDVFPTMSVWVKLDPRENFSRLVSEKSFRKILADSLTQNRC